MNFAATMWNKILNFFSRKLLPTSIQSNWKALVDQKYYKIKYVLQIKLSRHSE